MNANNTYPLLKWLTPLRLVALAVIALLLYALYCLRFTLAPVFIALFFAYALNPFIDKLEKRKINRTLASIMLMGVILIFFTVFIVYLIPATSNEINTLKRRLPEYFENLRLFINFTLAPWLEENAGVVLPPTVFELETLMQTQLEKSISELGSAVNQGMRTAFLGTLNIAKIILNIILVPFFLFFFLKDFPKIERDVRELIPVKYAPAVHRFADKANQTLAHFFRRQLTVALILALLYSIGLSIIGIDLAIFLGVLSGFLFLVPYIGLAFAFSLSALVSMLNFSGFSVLLWLLILYLTLPLVEMFFLTPKIVGAKLTLSPAVVIIALLTFGGLFGVVGIIIALPSTAILKLLFTEIMSYYHTTEFYSSPFIDGGDEKS